MIKTQTQTIPNYDIELEKRYQPENFWPDLLDRNCLCNKCETVLICEHNNNKEHEFSVCGYCAG